MNIRSHLMYFEIIEIVRVDSQSILYSYEEEWDVKVSKNKDY